TSTRRPWVTRCSAARSSCSAGMSPSSTGCRGDQVSAPQQPRTVLVEPKREVVEVVSDASRTVYVVEPVPTTGSSSGGVPTTRRILAGIGLAGGGSLASDVTLDAEYGITAGTACQGNDARLSDARTPLTHGNTHHSGSSDPITIT